MSNPVVVQERDDKELPTGQVPAAVGEKIPVHSPIPVLDTGMFEHMYRVAAAMARSEFIPEDLRGDNLKATEANCFLVVNQAVRWNADPFAIAQHVFTYKGKLGYEGKVVAAIVNASSDIEGDLDYVYEGEEDTDERKVIVRAKIAATGEVKEVDGTVGKWKTQNEHWQKSPDQMLAYRGAREWARRYKPDILLGVFSDDELETIALVNAAPPTPRPSVQGYQPLASQPAIDVDETVVDATQVEAEAVFAAAVVDFEGNTVEYEDPEAYVAAVEKALTAAPVFDSATAIWDESQVSDAVIVLSEMGRKDLAGRLGDAWDTTTERLQREYQEAQAAEQEGETESEGEEKGNEELDLEAPAIPELTMPMKDNKPNELQFRKQALAVLNMASKLDAKVALPAIDSIVEQADALIKEHKVKKYTWGVVTQRANEIRKGLKDAEAA